MKGPTREQSERKVKRKRNWQRQARKEHILKKADIENERIQKCMHVQEKKKLGWIFPSNFDKGWDVSCITHEHHDYDSFTFWSTWGQEWKTYPENRMWSKKERKELWAGTQTFCIAILVPQLIQVCPHPSLTTPIILFLQMQFIEFKRH